jgi:hypothetical protein
MGIFGQDTHVGNDLVLSENVHPFKIRRSG